MIGKLPLLAFLVILGVSLAIAAVQTLGWLLGGSAVVCGLLAVAWKAARDRDRPEPGPGPEPPEWTPKPRKRALLPRVAPAPATGILKPSPPRRP